MAVFFTCIILVGSGLLVFSLLLILAEKRRAHDYRNDINNKKEDLIKVIEDAELLVEEMNKFSDYVVSSLEQKHMELISTIEEADSKVDLLKGTLNVNTNDFETAGIEADSKPESETDDIQFDLSPDIMKKGKIIPFDVKRREIIKLSRGGMDSTQIARLLNIGKGEIELIAKMGK